MQKYMTTYKAIERMSVRVKRTRFMGGGAISLSSRRAKTDAADLDSCRAYISEARRNWTRISLAGRLGDISYIYIYIPVHTQTRDRRHQQFAARRGS